MSHSYSRELFLRYDRVFTRDSNCVNKERKDS